MLINVKMPTVVGILTFMSMINFILSLVEHLKSFITMQGLISKLQDPKKIMKVVFQSMPYKSMGNFVSVSL